jgi:hypothetical protein
MGLVLRNRGKLTANDYDNNLLYLTNYLNNLRELVNNCCGNIEWNIHNFVILRNDIGRKLSISEMDSNFTTILNGISEIIDNICFDTNLVLPKLTLRLESNRPLTPLQMDSNFILLESIIIQLEEIIIENCGSDINRFLLTEGDMPILTESGFNILLEDVL